MASWGIDSVNRFSRAGHCWPSPWFVCRRVRVRDTGSASYGWLRFFDCQPNPLSRVVVAWIGGHTDGCSYFCCVGEQRELLELSRRELGFWPWGACAPTTSVLDVCLQHWGELLPRVEFLYHKRSGQHTRHAQLGLCIGSYRSTWRNLWIAFIRNHRVRGITN